MKCFVEKARHGARVYNPSILDVEAGCQTGLNLKNQPNKKK
jgi:hypothetical protein